MIDCKECENRFVCFTLGKKERAGCPVEYMLVVEGKKLNKYGCAIHCRNGGYYQQGWAQAEPTMTYRTVGAAKRMRNTLIAEGEFEGCEIRIAKLEILPD